MDAPHVVKRHKRLWIDGSAGQPLYTPPDFIHIQSRDQLRALASDMEAMPYIDAVMAFEEKAAKRKGRPLPHKEPER